MAALPLSLVLNNGPVARAADGAWTLNGNGTWSTTGNWLGGIVADGTDSIADFSTLNIFAARTVTLNSARTIGHLRFGDTASTFYNWTLAQSGGSVLTLDVTTGIPTITVTGQTTTISLELAGDDGMAKEGSGTLVLSGVNTYTGPTAINLGTLTLSGSINSASSLELGGGTLNYAPTIGGSTQAFNGTTVNAGDSTITNSTAGNTLVLGTITRNAGGTLRVSSLDGTTTTTSVVDATGILGAWATVGSGANLRYAAGGSADGGTTAGAITAYTGGTAAATAADVTSTDGTVNYDVAAVGALGAGASVNTLRYTGAAGTITGDFTANGLMNAGTGAVTYSGGVTIGAGRELIVATDTQGITLSGVISDNGDGASSLVKAGGTAGQTPSGLLTLSGPNTYSGGTLINSGAVLVNHSSALGSGEVTVANGAQLQIGNGANIGNTLNIAGNSAIFAVSSISSSISGVVNLLGNAGQSAATNSNRTLTFTETSVINLNGYAFTFAPSGGSQPTVFNGTISGTGEVIKASGGNLTISSSQSFTGPFSLRQGGLLLGADGAIGTGVLNFVVADDQSATIRSLNTEDRTLSNMVTIGGTANSRHIFGSATTGNLAFTNTTDISLGSTNRRFEVFNTTRFDAAFTGTAGIIKQGTGATGTLILNGNNTYTGATTINVGTLQLGNGGATGRLSTSSQITVAAGASFAVNRSDTVYQGTDFRDGITGEGSFTHSGAGTTILLGNSYTGATNVDNGTLLIYGDNTASSGVNVAAGARIGGYYGSVGAVDFAAGAGLAYNIDDVLDSDGGLFTESFTGAGIGDFTLYLGGEANGFDTLADYTWTVLSSDSASIIALSLDNIAINTSAFGQAFGGTFTLSKDATSLYLNYTGGIIPEPSSFALLAGGALLGFALTRRRRG